MASTLLTTGGAGSATSFLTASITRQAGELTLIAIAARNNAIDGEVPDPIVTGAGGTWVLQKRVQTQVNRKLFVYGCRDAIGGSGALTIDFSGILIVRSQWNATEHTNRYGTTLSDAVVRKLGRWQEAALNVSLAVPMHEFAHASNEGYGAFFIGNSTTATAGSGWTALGQVAGSGCTVLTQVRTGDGGGCRSDATWVTASHSLGIALELRGPASGPALQVIPRHLTRGCISTTATSMATLESITPTANTLVIAILSSRRTGAPLTPTGVAGAGITFARVAAADVDYDTIAVPNRRVTMWVGSTPTPSTGPVTFTHSTSGTNRWEWTIFEVPDVVFTPGNEIAAFVQLVTARGDTVASLAATLAAGGASNNPFFAILTHDPNYGYPGAELGWLCGHEDDTPTQRATWLWKGKPDTSVGATLFDVTPASTGNAALIAFELTAAPASSDAPSWAARVNTILQPGRAQ